jgi:hypothetical protein
VGIFLGWIVQKRFLTLAAFLLNLVAAFTLPRLPQPFSYLFVVAPALLLTALIYEGFASMQVRIGRRVRLAFALWMGFSVLVLEMGILFSASNTTILYIAIAVFAVLALSGAMPVAFLSRRQVRNEQRTSGGDPASPAK